MAGSQSVELQLLSKTPVLITESANDFSALHAALIQEIKPRGIVEQIYVADISALVFEILRLRRCKNAVINTAFKEALEEIVPDLAGRPEDEADKSEWVDAILADWFTKPEARKEVLKLLKQFGLDESAIEAEAIRSRFSELEALDRMLTLLESRRNKAFRSIKDYRSSFAEELREVSNRLIETDPVIQLVDRSSQASA